MKNVIYINRELSWLQFNDRVLEEAQDRTNKLMERLKFLAITASNLDEFFMVRVASLWEMDASKSPTPDFSGLTPYKQLEAISKAAHEMVLKQYSCLNRSILPALEKENIFILSYDELDDKQRAYANRYYQSTVYPVLTPMAIDQSHPFPLLNNVSLYLIVQIADDDDALFAVVQVPTVLPRVLPLPAEDKQCFILLEDIITEHIESLFTGYEVEGSSVFRITRSSDVFIDEELTHDLLNEMEQSIKRRRWGDPVRLEIQKDASEAARTFLRDALKLEDFEIFDIGGPLDLTVWMGFSFKPAFEHLRNTVLQPQPVVDLMDKDIFDAIKSHDILVHHPYESFDCVVNFVKAAASDPKVLAIKQTLYRVSGGSPIVHALMQAAENGKQVTVLVELKARFDEENNIIWAKKLEKSGCHVVYGLVGLKIHCKLCLVVRMEDDGIHRYVHMGTGNYNDSTARIYTDLGFFTCKETFGQDASSLFNVLTGYTTNTKYNKLSVAPLTLRSMFYKNIEHETNNALAGKEACITAKMNSLVDKGIIDALYKASQAGVRIRLIVRGICCLKPGLPGVSDNITVCSIVDRFLEHSRIFYFENGGNPRIYLSSADWMPRNLDRRVEIAFPVDDPRLKEQIIEILDQTLTDTEKLRIQQSDGTYERVDRRGKEHVHSQLLFHEQASRRISAYMSAEHEQLFVPITNSGDEANT